MRNYYGFLGWEQHDPAIWKRLLEEARSAVIRDRKRLPKIVGSDRDARAIRVALTNLERAGLTGIVHVEKRFILNA